MRGEADTSARRESDREREKMQCGAAKVGRAIVCWWDGMGVHGRVWFVDCAAERHCPTMRDYSQLLTACNESVSV